MAAADEPVAAADPAAAGGTSADDEPQPQRAKKQKRARQKKIGDERARIDAAMKMLDDAKELAAQERQDYGRYLQWKVRMQRKDRVQRDKDITDQRGQVQEKLHGLRQQRKHEEKSSRRQWQQFADNPAPPKSKLAASTMTVAEGDRRHQQLVAERKQRRQQQLAQLQQTAQRAVDGSGQSPTHPHLTPNPPANASAAAGHGGGVNLVGAAPLPDRITYDDYCRAANRPLPMSVQVADQKANEAAKQRRLLWRKDRIEHMYSVAIQRRTAAMIKVGQDPPADSLMSHDIVKYIPPDFIAEIEREMGRHNPHATARAMAASAPPPSAGDRFFLTGVDAEGNEVQDESMKAFKVATMESLPAGGSGGGGGGKRGGGRKKSLSWSWLAKLPSPHEIPPLSDEEKRLRQEREREQLEGYLTEVARGYTRVHNRTECRGRDYGWVRQERYMLPTVKNFNLLARSVGYHTSHKPRAHLLTQTAPPLPPAGFGVATAVTSPRAAEGVGVVDTTAPTTALIEHAAAIAVADHTDAHHPPGATSTALVAA